MKAVPPPQRRSPVDEDVGRGEGLPLRGLMKMGVKPSLTPLGFATSHAGEVLPCSAMGILPRDDGYCP